MFGVVTGVRFGGSELLNYRKSSGILGQIIYDGRTEFVPSFVMAFYLGCIYMHFIGIMTVHLEYFKRICCVLIMRPPAVGLPIATRYASTPDTDTLTS